MSSPAHLAAMQRSQRHAAAQSPFSDTLQEIVNGSPARTFHATHLKSGSLAKQNADGGQVAVKALHFMVLKSAMPVPLEPRSLIRARNQRWLVEEVAGDDAVMVSWKFTCSLVAE